MSAAHSQIVATPLASALALAEAGFWVFPLEPIAGQPDRYRPFEKGWQAKATRDPAKIRDWWQSHPSRNIGIFTGKFRDDQALVVIDVDVRDGKPGQASLDTLCDLNDLPATWESRTASGGKHIAYSTDLPVSGAVDWLGTKDTPSGLDLRSSGNFIIAPGSVRKRGRYEIVNAIEPQPLPAWLHKLCSAPRERADQAPVAELDTSSAIARVTDYLRQCAPAVQGAGGDDQTYKVAARIKDMGVSEYQAQLLMLEHYDPRCIPPWGEEGIAAKVESAYAHGQNPPGSKAVTMDGFSPVAPEAPPRGRLYYKRPSQTTLDLDRQDLVEDLLSPKAMSVLYGASGQGKTFLAMDIGFHIATGRPWMGKECMKGLVVYVAAEAGGSSEIRAQALLQEHGVADFDMAIVPCPIDLFSSDTDAKALLEIVGQTQEAFGAKCLLLVVDTLSRAIAGGNESSSEDMGAFVRMVDRLRVAADCHVMVVHHSGKDESKGARGHSLLRAATDTELEAKDGVLVATKQRDMDTGDEIGFELVKVQMGVTTRGKPITSRVVRSRTVSVGPDDFALKPRARLLLGAFMEACVKEGSQIETGQIAITETIWRDYTRKAAKNATVGRDTLPEDPSSFRTAFARWRDSLVSCGRVVQIGEDQWVTG